MNPRAVLVALVVTGCGIAALPACSAPQPLHDAPQNPVLVAMQSEAGAVRLVVTGDLHVAHNWYEDEYGHSMDKKVDAAQSYEGTTTSLIVSSHDMSGVTLELRFARTGASDPTVTAFGTWRRDFGPRGGPRMGHLDELSGIVLVNTSYVDHADPLICRFLIVGKRNGRIVSVAGAVSTNAPKLR